MTTADKFKVGLWVVGGIIFATWLGVAVWSLLHKASDPKAPSALDAGH